MRTPKPKPAKPDASKIDRAIDAGILIGLAVLILVGFATSYRTLRDLAITEGGYPPWLAPAVPLSFDLGIVVLSLKVARAAREGRTAPVMRALVVLLSTATVVANAAGATTSTARLLHVVPVAMFVVCFESVVIAARRRALEQRGLLPQPLPRIRAVRWMLALPSTWSLWRSMVLAPDVEPPRPAPSLPLAVPDSARLVLGASEDVSARHQATCSSRAAEPPRVRTQPSSERDREVDALLRLSPGMSSSELRRRLAAAGWAVSGRTAQRLRAKHAAVSPQRQTDSISSTAAS